MERKTCTANYSNFHWPSPSTCVVNTIAQMMFMRTITPGFWRELMHKLQFKK